tara:strand:+ start:495 stop:827 length:333 start_codon:yes stop_codon:yes gene_type:complete
MDRVTIYINKVLSEYAIFQDAIDFNADICNDDDDTKNKAKLDVFLNRPIGEQAIIQLDNDRKERFQQLLEAKDALRRVKKYDARNMSLMQFIKLKYNGGLLCLKDFLTLN